MWHKPNGAMSESYEDLVPEQEFEFSLGFAEGFLPTALIKPPSAILRPIAQQYRDKAIKTMHRNKSTRRLLAHMRSLGF